MLRGAAAFPTTLGDGVDNVLDELSGCSVSIELKLGHEAIAHRISTRHRSVHNAAQAPNEVKTFLVSY